MILKWLTKNENDEIEWNWLDHVEQAKVTNKSPIVQVIGTDENGKDVKNFTVIIDVEAYRSDGTRMLFQFDNAAFLISDENGRTLEHLN